MLLWEYMLSKVSNNFSRVYPCMFFSLLCALVNDSNTAVKLHSSNVNTLLTLFEL